MLAPSNAEKLQIQTKMKHQSFKQPVTSAPGMQPREAPRNAGDVDADPPERNAQHLRKAEVGHVPGPTRWLLEAAVAQKPFTL